MPDWTYQTVFRPTLRWLPFSVAQALVFRTMGRLGRTMIGRAVIGFMGHAKPPLEVEVSKCELVFPGPCGLACGVDLSAQAVSATSLFGFGLIEVGPVCSTTNVRRSQPTTQWRQHGLAISRTEPVQTSQELIAALRKNTYRNGVPVFVRLLLDSETTASSLESLAEEFNDVVDGFTVVLNHADAPNNSGELFPKLTALKSSGVKLLIVVNAQSADAVESVQDWRDRPEIDGMVLESGGDHTGSRGLLSGEVVSAAAASIASLVGVSDEWLTIVSGGVEEPADALRLLDAGADLVLVDSGFAVAGPGLAKRINNAVCANRIYDSNVSGDTAPKIPFTHRSWFWAFLLGLGLTVGGLVAVVVGWTRVVLPYDEEFLGMLREEICSLNSQLLPFMSHDRVTLAGTMLALGPLYMLLAWFGDRRGMHWARVAFLSSAFVGFLSFFSFLGFGYFDPFHAFISVVLFQLTTLCLRSSQPICRVVEFDLHNSRSWRRAMWGQLLMVIQGFAILVAGVCISGFGVTTVFVPEDLEFMQTTREALIDANPRLVPLVAHDRASFGGMLMSTGVTVFLASLWGWQRGRRWLWYALGGTGSAAYGMTILIHWHVGYTSLLHLLPAYGGLFVLGLGLLLSKEWMFEDASQPGE